jgi:hypothetical protein
MICQVKKLCQTLEYPIVSMDFTAHEKSSKPREIIVEMNRKLAKLFGHEHLRKAL